MLRRFTKSAGWAGLCCGLGLLIAAPADAQQRLGQQDQDSERNLRQQQFQTQRHTAEKELSLATDLIGMTVKIQGEEEWGQIQNLLVNTEGHIQYVALSQGATASVDRSAAQQRSARAATRTDAQGQLILVPWDMAKIHSADTPTESYVLIEIEKDRLMQAPKFSQQQLTTRQGFVQVTTEVDQFFNVRQRRGAARPELNQDRGTSNPQRQNRQQPQDQQPQDQQPQDEQPQQPQEDRDQSPQEDDDN